MQIRAYIENGPHITFKQGHGWRAFEENPVTNYGSDPSIALPTSVLYTGHVPTELLAVIRHYSIYDGLTVHRMRGNYRLKDAEAIVTYSSNKDWIEAYGKTLTNVAELCERIRVGDIAPVVSHDGQQVESTVLGVKEALHRLIDSLALAFGQWRLRLMK